MLKLSINESGLIQVIKHLVDETSKSWKSSKDVDLKTAWQAVGISPSGKVATGLTSWLIKKDLLLERRRGRLGVTWKWNSSYTTPDAVATRYIQYLHSLELKLPETITKMKLRPSEFRLGEYVFFMHNNAIVKDRIIQIKLDQDNNITYGIQTHSNQVEWFEYENLFISIDECLIKLKNEAEERFPKALHS